MWGGPKEATQHAFFLSLGVSSWGASVDAAAVAPAVGAAGAPGVVAAIGSAVGAGVDPGSPVVGLGPHAARVRANASISTAAKLSAIAPFRTKAIDFIIANLFILLTPDSK